MLGGIGSCGRALCCHSWPADFEPVSIKMSEGAEFIFKSFKDIREYAEDSCAV